MVIVFIAAAVMAMTLSKLLGAVHGGGYDDYDRVNQIRVYVLDKFGNPVALNNSILHPGPTRPSGLTAGFLVDYGPQCTPVPNIVNDNGVLGIRNNGIDGAYDSYIRLTGSGTDGFLETDLVLPCDAGIIAGGASRF